MSAQHVNCELALPSLNIFRTILSNCSRLLKIAHIGNTAGIASVLADEQLNKNHDVEVFVFDELQQKQFGGVLVNYAIFPVNKERNKSINLKWPFERKRLFERLKKFEVWHYHYPYGSLKKNISKNIKDQILLNHYHGDDLRNKRDDNFCAVSTPDLLKFAPLGMWVPSPVNLDFLNRFMKLTNIENKVPKIAHYPHYEVYAQEKYHDYYSRALLNLEEMGKCEVVRILRLDYPSTLSKISECDIVIGKILPRIGWFGKFELEGMALGKPVITYVSDDLFEKYRPPVYRTTQGTLQEDLQALMEDMAEQKRLAKEGRLYIANNHSVKHVCNLVQKCYEICSNPGN